MAFNLHQYNTQYTLNARAGGEPLNDAAHPYDVRIKPAANVAEGETYWRVIGIHHLTPLENFSNHHVYIEALDEEGRRIQNPIAWAGWSWEGRQPQERADPVALDKPDYEAAGNIAMFFGQTVSVWLKGQNRDGNDKTDTVENLHSRHPDEPLADGRLLNTLGHHSFYVVFQRTRKAATVTDGVITGRVERGQGQTVRLFKDNQFLAEQVLDQTLTFRFQNLSPGLYRLEVAGTDVGQDGLKIDANNRTITVNLAIPIPDDSVIFGRVTNGAGRTLLLVKQGTIIFRLQIPPAETYQFSDLAEGVYSIQVFETSIRQDNITLDGTNRREVNLLVPITPEQPTPKTITHYLLLGPPNSRGRQTNLLLASNYVLAFSVTVGFNVEEAKLARQVTILGEGISAADEQAIRDSGSEVERLSGNAYDIEAQLSGRIRDGRATGG